MNTIKPEFALGLYADSAVNEVDVSAIETDGLDLFGKPLSLSRPYPEELREEILSIQTPQDFANFEKIAKINKKVTDFYISVLTDFVDSICTQINRPAVIGLKGHPLKVEQKGKRAITLGLAQEIANALKIPVCSDFIATDLAAGGYGGPLFPSFFEALTKVLEKPLVFVSLGGIVSVCFIGPEGQLQAFDVGAGNILLDTWVQRKTGEKMDYDGLLSAKGRVDEKVLKHLLTVPYLLQPPPKTLDRNDFNFLLEQIYGLSPADGCATLTAFIAQSLIQAANFFPTLPKQWILSGGGTFNPTLMLYLKRRLNEMHIAGEFGWDKNTLEAQGYAFLAMRNLFGLPASFPTTTGVLEPIPPGKLYQPMD